GIDAEDAYLAVELRLQDDVKRQLLRIEHLIAEWEVHFVRILDRTARVARQFRGIILRWHRVRVQLHKVIRREQLDEFRFAEDTLLVDLAIRTGYSREIDENAFRLPR